MAQTVDGIKKLANAKLEAERSLRERDGELAALRESTSAVIARLETEKAEIERAKAELEKRLGVKEMVLDGAAFGASIVGGYMQWSVSALLPSLVQARAATPWLRRAAPPPLRATRASRLAWTRGSVRCSRERGGAMCTLLSVVLLTCPTATSVRGGTTASHQSSACVCICDPPSY